MKVLPNPGEEGVYRSKDGPNNPRHGQRCRVIGYRDGGLIVSFQSAHGIEHHPVRTYEFEPDSSPKL